VYYKLCQRSLFVYLVNYFACYTLAMITFVILKIIIIIYSDHYIAHTSHIVHGYDPFKYTEKIFFFRGEMMVISKNINLNLRGHIREKHFFKRFQWNPLPPKNSVRNAQLSSVSGFSSYSLLNHRMDNNKLKTVISVLDIYFC